MTDALQRNIDAVMTNAPQDGIYQVVIWEQTHRCESFSEKGYYFKASNGVVLNSIGGPMKVAPGIYDMRGLFSDIDDIPIMLSKEEADRLMEAIVEYNERNGGPLDAGNPA